MAIGIIIIIIILMIGSDDVLDLQSAVEDAAEALLELSILLYSLGLLPRSAVQAA